MFLVLNRNNYKNNSKNSKIVDGFSTSKKKSILFVASFIASALSHAPAYADLTFDFNYINSGSNIGFLDPVNGPSRQAALQQSSALVGSYFSNYDATVTFDVKSEDNSSSNTLASAGSSLGTVGLGNTSSPFLHTVVQQNILHGTDANGIAADAEIIWNFGVDWGLGDTVSDLEYDFKSAAVHEILHTMGFTSMVQSGGAGAISTPGNPDIWNTSDQFLTDKDGNRIIDELGVFDPGKIDVLTSGTEADNLTPTGNGTFFNGANAVTANEGNKVHIYSPNTFAPGSSIAHLDDAFYSTQEFLMEAATEMGLGIRVLAGLEIGFLKDIGYTQIVDPFAINEPVLQPTSTVPVPATVWLMGSGIMFLLGMGHRHKKGS